MKRDYLLLTLSYNSLPNSIYLPCPTNPTMGENEEQQVQGLLSDFSSLQSRFQGLQNLVSRHHVKRYCELDTQMGIALSATLSLARLLNGEFNPSNPPAELASTLQTMESNWAQTKDAAKKGYDELSSYSATVFCVSIPHLRKH
jgi:hypothetical protein